MKFINDLTKIILNQVIGNVTLVIEIDSHQWKIPWIAFMVKNISFLSV
jgi:hypothetical protein